MTDRTTFQHKLYFSNLQLAEESEDIVNGVLGVSVERTGYLAQFQTEEELSAAKRARLVELTEAYGCSFNGPSVGDLFLDGPMMTPGEYQQCALRTIYPDLDTNSRLGLCGLGLPGEIGEVVDLIKKFLYHRNGKGLPVDKLKDELGDVLWYYFILLDTLGLTFETVLLTNARKLEERHPRGFNPHYTSDSHASEV
jgi:NTP pyrophosphatase (non-canonical NTP hydrolase)